MQLAVTDSTAKHAAPRYTQHTLPLPRLSLLRSRRFFSTLLPVTPRPPAFLGSCLRWCSSSAKRSARVAGGGAARLLPPAPALETRVAGGPSCCCCLWLAVAVGAARDPQPLFVFPGRTMSFED